MFGNITAFRFNNNRCVHEPSDSPPSEDRRPTKGSSFLSGPLLKCTKNNQWRTPQHLPVRIRGPREDKAAGDELRDDSGTKASRSSEQSGLAGGFSILAHYFPTSSASFRHSSRTLKLLKSTASTGSVNRAYGATEPASHPESPEGH